MRFSVPQFIEHTPKIVGPLTFKQFSFIGGAGGICFLLYYILPSSLFYIVAFILVLGGGAMAFLKINGKALPLALADMFKFSLEGKIYLWKRKEHPMVLYKEHEQEKREHEQEKRDSIVKKIKEGEKKQVLLKIGGESRLKKIHTNIETKTK